VRRHRDRDEQMRAAPWRADPPVSDELWARVTEVRRSKTRGGGPRRRGRVDLLGGLLECVCGRHIRSDGTFADGRHRKLHLEPCGAWGPQARLGYETWEEPILAQVSGIQIGPSIMARVVAALGSGARPVAIDRSRIERQLREIALEHAAGSLGDETYIERSRQMRASLSAIEEAPQRVSAERAVAWLRALAETWEAADVPEARADLLHAIYERIAIAGSTIVGARLTSAAYANGLALALPDKVVMARPEGFEPPTI